MGKRKAAGSSASPKELLVSLSARLSTSRTKFFHGQEEKVSYLKDILQRTVDKGESNSLLLLGPGGVGKTSLTEEVLRQVGRTKSWQDNAVLVKLSGIVQTDDKVALRDITKQLKLENVVQDKVFGSFSEHLSFLLASLKAGDSSTSKPIVFILDEFDSFCSHKNQTLLYNLFDVAQSKAVPICVIGISRQIDVTELLEKRVKSRFSHRHLYMWPQMEVADFIAMASGFLTLDLEVSSTWDHNVKTLFDSKTTRSLFSSVFDNSKSISGLKKLLYLSVVELVRDEGGDCLELKHLELAKAATSQTQKNNSLSNQIKDLPILELSLLIAIKHLCQIYDNEPFNFEMVFHEYVKFKRRKMPSLPDERSVVTKSWENLLSLELVLPKGSRNGDHDQFSLNTSVVPAGDLNTAVEKHSQCPTEVEQWLASSHHIASH